MHKFEMSESNVLPMFMMAVFSMYVSLSFVSVGMLLQYHVLLGIMLASSLIAFFLIARQRTIMRYDFASYSFLLVVLLVSLVNNLDWKTWICTLMSISLLICVFNYYSRRIGVLLIGALIGFSISVYAGFLFTALHPEKWMLENDKDATEYLLGGNYNQMGPIILCAFLTNILCLKISKWFWINMVPLLVAGMATLLMVQSMTSVTSIILFFLLCLIPNVRLQRLSIAILFVSVLLFEFFVCFSGTGLENSEIATWFIVDVLEKDITFTGRTEMWDSALRIITESPLWGYGFPAADWYEKNMSSFAIGPHNMILAVFIYGGIVAFVLYVYCLLYSILKLVHFKDRMSNAILASISVLSLMMLMEVYLLQLVFYLLLISFYYASIRSQFVKV